MSVEVPQDAQEIINQEDQILQNVIRSLHEQREHYLRRSQIEDKRARELTAKIVATRRDDDKALLASDEAVSHALSEQNRKTLKVIDKLIKRPYFGRIILREESSKGELKEIEYKIGFSANPDCRIIDWRKAPISKLFYEYKEGDEYSEIIQGTERDGKVLLRNTVEIENSALKRVTCRLGTFERRENGWTKLQGAVSTAERGSSSSMPEVLSLITAEQFRSITSEATSAVLIQGVAGSGKTTVALHRLSWLLDPENGALDAKECLILVLTTSLKNYITNTLPQLGLEEVKVATIDEWNRDLISRIAPKYIDQDGRIRRAEHPTPSSIDRVKRSMAILNSLESHARSGHITLENIAVQLLTNYHEILAHDETKLIDKKLVDDAYSRSKENVARDAMDPADEALFIRCAEIINQGLPLPNGRFGRYKHIVVDEVQDLSATELAAVIGAAEKASGLTIVGDISQTIDRNSTFPGWDRLRKFWDEKESVAQFFNLMVSHRSTAQIMKYAEHVLRRTTAATGRQGRVPIWFSAPKEQLGVKSVLQWLATAIERYPSQLTAVICRDEAEAKYAHSLLRPSFGEMVRLGDQYSFSFDAGIIVSDIKQVKGLEFCNVLLWNPSEKSYPSSDSLSANLLYVGITRAQENLCLVTWNAAASCLPQRNSAFVRAMQVTSEE